MSVDKDVAPGLPLIDSRTLQKDFVRFKNDALYFISNITYVPSDDEVKPDEPKGNRNRILAVTPQALFVCDAVGTMDRAVRLEALDGVVWEKRTVKHMFSKEEQIFICIKCPAEFDILCIFEGNKDPTNLGMFKNFARVLEIGVPYKKKKSKNVPGSTTFVTTELQPGAKIEEQVKKDRPSDYLSPKDIIAQNQARQRLIELLEALNRESVDLYERSTRLHQSTADKYKELAALEGAVSGDVNTHRQRREDLQKRHQAMHKEQVALEVELMRLQAEINTESVHLQEERENADQLVKDSLSAASSETDKKMQDDEALRKRANARELDKALKHLASLKAKIAIRPQCTGPQHVLTRVDELENKIAEAAAKWEKEMETANKLEGFFDAAISDLTLLNEQITMLLERKSTAIRERNEKQQALMAPKAVSKPVAQAATTSFDDDDLLGGPAPNAAPAARGAPVASIVDDDLLGGPAPPQARGFDDDDLLGGPSNTTAAAPIAAAGDDLL